MDLESIESFIAGGTCKIKESRIVKRPVETDWFQNFILGLHVSMSHIPNS